jgi:hypothetical protein
MTEVDTDAQELAEKAFTPEELEKIHERDRLHREAEQWLHSLPVEERPSHPAVICHNHPHLRWMTKGPWIAHFGGRSMFFRGWDHSVSIDGRDIPAMVQGMYGKHLECQDSMMWLRWATKEEVEKECQEETKVIWVTRAYDKTEMFLGVIAE